jgi:hypothetical protein
VILKREAIGSSEISAALYQYTPPVVPEKELGKCNRYRE